ncbi:cation:proton antiporter [Rhodobacteraceae bacterium HSP-20]|uniref:Cation:proton antiporter n=1 Tax=Paragemmobacter amnigenus TaxID=2852097 RepID=A0ABS6IZ60_9RHOB|nr:cation:proton antiporter [Rhodobacter amnigenus]MBU9696804.1 cation:proton antiporter [Rhodobacter amnigenus]MBV4388031.1 cation:proton antiporter [Rhodobacter amnigenus]
MEGLLFEASIYLGAAVLVVPLAIRLGLGSVLGYLAAGILVGPVFGLTGADTADLQHFAEFGVVLMLFLIGLELEPRTLWDMRHRLLGLGGAQVVLTGAALALAVGAMGYAWQVALTFGMILSLSSTAIVLQTLSEKNLMRTAGGRASFSVLLTQDIAVIPMLAFLPLLALPAIIGPTANQFGVSNPVDDAAAHGSEGAAEPLLTLVDQLPNWAAATLTLAIVAGIVLAGHFLSRPVFRFVHASRLPEMSTFISLLIVLGIAFLMMMVGLSPALGTFVAGVVLANSEFRHQIEADIKPFKGLLLGLFFMTVGIGIDTQELFAQPATILGLTLLLIAIKAAILYVIAILFKLRGHDRWLFTLGLAQAGEFGFVLVSFARQQGILSLNQGQVALLVISLSMLLTPALFIAYERLATRLRGRAAPERAPDTIDEKGRVIIAGIGRFGQVVNRLVRMSGLSTVVLDSDMATIETMRRFGVKGFFGDPSNPALLDSAGLDEAAILVVAVDDRDNATRIVRYARSKRADLHIVARARDRVHVYELYQAGANDIVRETFDSSIRAGRYVLENMGFTEYEAAKLSQTYYKVDRAAMRDLASLWIPGQPVHLNEAYVDRAKQLDRDLETALIDELHETQPMAGEDVPAPFTEALPDETDADLLADHSPRAEAS